MHKMVPSLIALSLAAAATAQPASAPTLYQRQIAAGYKALTLCSAMFNAGRKQADVEALELKGIYPDYDAIVPTLPVAIDKARVSVAVTYAPAMPPQVARWQANEGCTILPPGSDPLALVAFSLNLPKPRPASAAPWPQGDRGIAVRPSPALDASVARAFDHASYGSGAETVGVVILRDGNLVAERYAPGFGPFTANRTWSVGKSITGTLAGMAVKAGEVNVDAPTDIVNWHAPGNRIPDPRAAITLDHLLRMGSGLHSDTAGNRTDAIYFGGVAVDDKAFAWALEAKPGTRFRYANNDILLAARLLMTQNRDAEPENYPEHRLFGPLGMSHTVAERDWHGNYVLSSQVWSTARDLARLGQFWLQDGIWAGRRLLPVGWMRYMTAPSGPQPEDGAGYSATLWLFGPKQGLPEGSYAAQGNRGQYIMVIPSKKLVVVRRGEDPGAARFDIAKFAADVAATVP
jgi:CubicO group peptidase (beta-lactamase class C family)